MIGIELFLFRDEVNRGQLLHVTYIWKLPKLSSAITSSSLNKAKLSVITFNYDINYDSL